MQNMSSTKGSNPGRQNQNRENPSRNNLGEFEQIVLWSVVRLGEDAYGVPIRQDIEKRTGRSLTVGALYRTLDRLEEKGLLTSKFSDPTPERGGRSKRYFRAEPAALRALQESRRALEAMWEGLRLDAPGKGAAR